MTARPSHRTRHLIAVVALGGMLLTACGGGSPDEKRVALDVIESMGGDEPGELTEDQQQCMVDKVEADYTQEELAAIGNANVDLDRPGVNFEEDGTPELNQFYEDLRQCVSEGGTETPSTSGETGTTTDGGETGTTTSGSATTVPGTTAPATTVPVTTTGT